MVSVSDIVSQLGGAEAAARALGVGTEAVRKWRQTGVIPSRHWPAIVGATGLAFTEMPGAQSGGDPGLDAPPGGATAVLVLNDGAVLWGRGFGAHGEGAVGEVCFNTGMTGYQETLTDPSYAGQIITFTFPHIGNIGANYDDMEANFVAARGVVIKQDIGAASNWRAVEGLDAWLRRQGLAGISGVDTRALTMRIRDGGPPHGVLAYPADGRFDIAGLRAQAQAWPGLDGMDLAREVSCTQSYEWDAMTWAWPGGFGRQAAPVRHVVAVDYGAKRNILRCLAASGCRVTVVPAQTGGAEILGLRPDGVFLSNGPGDPAATADYAVPAIQAVLAAGVPIFGICLGHQLLAHALGGRTRKMAMGHRGANQPVMDLATRRVAITSQNHGFEVDEASLPEGVIVTHRSLFDGSNEGISCAEKRCFSVQYHPEASPGPSDSQYLFRRFVESMNAAQEGS
jgi:carbamoyl-phosphate synthase small subunit